jgi:hypothetical protein
MKMDLTVETMGKVTLTDKNYLGSGGEANIYVKDRTAYKIYHDANKMIPVGKIKELSQISSKNVLKPKNIIRDKNNDPVGYTMRYLKTNHPLCKLFTKAFKQKHNVSNNDIIELIKEMQKTIVQIHNDGCLIVDLNELNLLVSAKFETPYFIDVDSYQTASYKATAIMDSVRDRLVKNNQFTQLSDWYSFAILAFQLYIGIHPYKGRHPDYKANEWGKRMDEGVSVFDKDVTVPRVCNDFSVIPSKHMEWFRALFVRNERMAPPMVDGVVTVIPMPATYIHDTADFEATLAHELNERIISVFDFMGVKYIVGANNVYKEKACLPSDIDGCKVEFCECSDMTPIVCKLKDELLIFEDIAKKEIGRLSANQMMYRDGSIYSTYGGHLRETNFEKIGTKIFPKTRVTANVSELTTKVFDGVIFQDLLGKCYVTLPYEKGKCLTLPVKELNGYRLLEARSEKNICGIMAEKRGVYYRFVMVFDKSFTSYTMTRADDVTYAPINLTVLPNGVCIMVADSDAQVFIGSKLRVVSDPPFDSSTRLFNSSGTVFFVEDKKIYSVKMKK